jgi:hypothetical protein
VRLGCRRWSAPQPPCVAIRRSAGDGRLRIAVRTQRPVPGRRMIQGWARPSGQLGPSLPTWKPVRVLAAGLRARARRSATPLRAPVRRQVCGSRTRRRGMRPATCSTVLV